MKHMNNRGFTLIEVLVAMVLVVVVASFAATAIASSQKSTIQTKSTTAGMDKSFTQGEKYLASDSESGTVGDNLKLKRVSGDMAEFPDMDLQVKNTQSSYTDEEGNVKYIAFKHRDEGVTPSSPSGSVSASGGGVTSSEDANSDDAGSGGAAQQTPPPNGDVDAVVETPAETPTSAPVVETPTEAPTSAPVVETPTSAPVVETPVEATTAATGAINPGYEIPGATIKYYDWSTDTFLEGSIKIDANVSMPIYYAKVAEITTDGIKISQGSTLNIGALTDTNWQNNYRLVIKGYSPDDKNKPKLNIGGNNVDMSSGSYTLPNNNGCNITFGNCDFIITSLEYVKV